MVIRTSQLLNFQLLCNIPRASSRGLDLDLSDKSASGEGRDNLNGGIDLVQDNFRWGGNIYQVT